jgi:hypothetical protein
MFWANFGTTFCNVTHAKAVLLLRLLLAIAQHIKWVHIKLCDTNKESWASK